MINLIGKLWGCENSHSEFCRACHNCGSEATIQLSLQDLISQLSKEEIREIMAYNSKENISIDIIVETDEGDNLISPFTLGKQEIQSLGIYQEKNIKFWVIRKRRNNLCDTCRRKEFCKLTGMNCGTTCTEYKPRWGCGKPLPEPPKEDKIEELKWTGTIKGGEIKCLMDLYNKLNEIIRFLNKRGEK